MAKDKIVFLCTSCGMDYPKAYGKCPSCGAWNSFVEQKVHKTVPDKIPHGYINVNDNERPQLINDVKIPHRRNSTRFSVAGWCLVHSYS